MINNFPSSAIIRSIAFLTALCVLVGCSRKSDLDLLSPSQAHQRFVQLLKDDNDLGVIVNELEHTFWVYLPLETNLFRMKADPKGYSNSAVSTVKPTIQFLNGEHRDGDFYLTYDIAPAKGYAKSYGYTSEFSEEYRNKQRHILTAIYRVFSEAENPPTFFIIVVADIISGLESRTIIHFQDLKRAYVDQSFHEEYTKRIISEQPVGNVGIIGDRTGESIAYSDMTWPEFLSKQMVFRVNFKYQRSAFPPSDDTRIELLNIAADTIAAYDFKDFTSIQLHDLGNAATFSTAREDLAGYRSEPPSKGRLIHIKFGLPTDEDVK